jgi:hypothetical protein
LFFYCISFSQKCPDTCDYYIPNTLTPDCDKVGCEKLDVISNCGFTKFELSIYNKWGELVFKSISPQSKFDCTGHENGSYLWKLKGEFCDSKRVNDSGTILIINNMHNSFHGLHPKPALQFHLAQQIRKQQNCPSQKQSLFFFLLYEVLSSRL